MRPKSLRAAKAALRSASGHGYLRRVLMATGSPGFPQRSVESLLQSTATYDATYSPRA